MRNAERELSRRGFLGLMGAGALGAMGTAALAGCAPGSSAGSTQVGAEPTVADKSSPIEPAPVPEVWDEEADVVVVGSGGGLVAAAYAVSKGKRVVVLEKSASWGGTSKETDIFSVMGTQTQQAIYQALAKQMGDAGQADAAAQFEQLGSLDPQVMRAQWKAAYFTKPGAGDVGELPNGQEGPRACAAVTPMLDALVQCIPEAIDFMGSIGVPWGPVTEFGSTGFVSGVCPQGSEKGGIVSRANYSAFEVLYDYCVDKGVTFHFNTPAQTLVMDGDAVVGVRAAGEVASVRAADGVILATGGMAFNEDMLRKYVPHVINRCFSSTTSTSDEGDGIRMGLGAGAMIAGYDSAFIFDGGVDCGSWGRYLYKGDVQFARQPWMLVNVKGERVPYYPVTTLGFTKQASIHMQNPGHCSYAICDSHYDEIIGKWDAEGKNQLICRNPITRERWAEAGENVNRIAGMTDEDYSIGVQEAIDGGWIVEAQTVEELAEGLGLDAGVLKAAIEDWNALCDKGVDELYGYAPEWLNKVQDPPFYGVKVGGTVLGTMCGLAPDTSMRVLDEKARPIPGLYAAGCTLGGLGGDSTYGDCRNPGGGVAMSCGTAYQAAKTICG